ncbi:MAG: hypothetical protein PVG39_00540 [Desulfobacteraceae bacterium]|jgi:DNA-binding cell septation regulator SpoVG
MAKKVTLEELKKNAKALNKLELTDESVDTDTDDSEELAEDFMNAMEEIDDDGKTDEVDKKIIKFYVRVMDQFDGESKGEAGGDDLRDELEDMEIKEVRAYIKENDLEIKTKVTKKNLSKVIDEIMKLSSKSGNAKGGTKDAKSAAGDFDRDELEETLTDMEYKEVKAYIKDNGLDIDMPKKKAWEDESEDIIEEILDAMEEKAKSGDAGDAGGKFDRDTLEEELGDMEYKEVKAFVKENGLEVDLPKKKDWEDESEDAIEEILDAMEEKAESTKSNKANKGGKGKGKAADKDKSGKLPKGMRKDSLPAKIYEKLQKSEMSIMDIAKLIGKEKKKDADKCINMAVRTIAKSIAKSCAINILYKNSGDLSDGKVSIASDDD